MPHPQLDSVNIFVDLKTNVFLFFIEIKNSIHTFILFCIKSIYLLLTASIIICSVTQSIAQDNLSPKSLLNQLKIEKNDSLKIIYLNELAWVLRQKNPDKALAYANEAKLFAIHLNLKKEEATSLVRIGEIKRLQGEYTEGISFFKQALEIEQKINNLYGIARAYGQLSLSYKHIGELTEALQYGEKSIAALEQIPIEKALANAYDSQAVLLRNTGKIDEALELIFKGLKIRENLNDSSGMIYSMMNLANYYSNLSNYNKSIEYNLKAIQLSNSTNDEYNLAKVYTNIGITYYKLKDYQASIDYNLKSIQLKKDFKVNKNLDANYTNIGNAFNALGDAKMAEDYYLKSANLKLSIGKKDALSSVYNNLGNIYFRKNNYKRALDYYTQGLAYANKDEGQIILIELYLNIYKTNLLLGNLETAIFFNDKYIVARDSFDGAFREALIIKDNYEEELKKNELLIKDTRIKEIQLKRKDLFIRSLIAGGLMLCLLFFVLIRVFQLRQKAKLAMKNQKISEQHVDKLLKDQELKAISAMLEGQEGERRRIAQDLHDRLGSMLSMVKIHFKSVEEHVESLRENNKVQYKKANTLLDEACDEVRKIAHDMVSGVLNKFGLIPALKNIKESVEASGQLKIEVLEFGFDEDRLEYDIEINIYRIIQELLSNILKHAHASEMSIQLIKKANNLNMVVEDNGVGFNVDEQHEIKGMGLVNVASRVDKLDGEFKIDSGKGAGTTITIDIPLN